MVDRVRDPVAVGEELSVKVIVPRDPESVTDSDRVVDGDSLSLRLRDLVNDMDPLKVGVRERVCVSEAVMDSKVSVTDGVQLTVGLRLTVFESESLPVTVLESVIVSENVREVVAEGV